MTSSCILLISQVAAIHSKIWCHSHISSLGTRSLNESIAGTWLHGRVPGQGLCGRHAPLCKEICKRLAFLLCLGEVCFCFILAIAFSDASTITEPYHCSGAAETSLTIISIWWRHEMETFSALLAICAGNSPVPGEFPAQRPVTRSFGVFFDLRLNKRLSKQSWGWWFETPSRPLWRHCDANTAHGTTRSPFY